MKSIQSTKTSRQLPEISDQTRVRVLSRIEALNRPYQAKRRDFTPVSVKRNRVLTSLLKGFVWTQI